jgi:hypothetical protein
MLMSVAKMTAAPHEIVKTSHWPRAYLAKVKASNCKSLFVSLCRTVPSDDGSRIPDAIRRPTGRISACK